MRSNVAFSLHPHTTSPISGLSQDTTVYNMAILITIHAVVASPTSVLGIAVAYIHIHIHIYSNMYIVIVCLDFIILMFTKHIVTLFLVGVQCLSMGGGGWGRGGGVGVLFV